MSWEHLEVWLPTFFPSLPQAFRCLRGLAAQWLRPLGLVRGYSDYFRVTIGPLKMLIFGARSRFAVGRPSPKPRKPKLVLCLAEWTLRDGMLEGHGQSSPPSTPLQPRPLQLRTREGVSPAHEPLREGWLHSLPK